MLAVAAVATVTDSPAPFLLLATAPNPWQPVAGTEAVRQVRFLFPCTKHDVSGTLPRTFLAKQMYRLGRLELLAVS